ncbi:MAG: hypothetical protein COB67_11410 [SAR324 cluster bacterium]|uniref:Prepilin-type N-terminal cleavage/methylation domain-containing protein n=1 Tax=SAR324 cluster bacterium TaxID=2024889 RepID=A0A2A4SUA8_9DELT|nr:MAG: hypothetical protein COB67_11410 [SAR324 cluster bacterium]
MEKKYNGEYSAKATVSPGLSLLELLITTLICSILMGIFSTQYPALQRMSYRFLEQSNFEEKYLIFLIKLEEQFQMTELNNAQDLALLQQMTFRIDYAWDGQYTQASDRIAYQWNAQQQRIEQRKGNGAFNGIIGGIRSFSWTPASATPFCYRLDLKSLYSERLRSNLFCRQALTF